MGEPGLLLGEAVHLGIDGCSWTARDSVYMTTAVGVPRPQWSWRAGCGYQPKEPVLGLGVGVGVGVGVSATVTAWVVVEPATPVRPEKVAAML